MAFFLRSLALAGNASLIHRDPGITVAFKPGDLLRTILRDARWPGDGGTGSPLIRIGLAVLTLVVLGFAGFAVSGGPDADPSPDHAATSGDGAEGPAAAAGEEGAPGPVPPRSGDAPPQAPTGSGSGRSDSAGTSATVVIAISGLYAGPIVTCRTSL